MCLFPLLARNNKAPVKAEISEPNNTASFDSLIKRELSKERLVMKIDMVNPIPAANLTDSNFKILTSQSIFPILILYSRIHFLIRFSILTRGNERTAAIIAIPKRTKAVAFPL